MEPGQVTEVGPGVRRVVAPNPGMMTGPGTNTYLVGRGDLALIDPGPDDDAHLAALLEASASGGDRLRWILVTHTHIDHSPLAARLKKATGAQVVAYGPSPVIPSTISTTRSARLGGRVKGRDAHEKGFVPDRRMRDGQALATRGSACRGAHSRPCHQPSVLRSRRAAVFRGPRHVRFDGGDRSPRRGPWRTMWRRCSGYVTASRCASRPGTVR